MNWSIMNQEEKRELRFFIFQEQSARSWSPSILLFPASQNNRDRGAEEIHFREKWCFLSSLTCWQGKKEIMLPTSDRFVSLLARYEFEKNKICRQMIGWAYAFIVYLTCSKCIVRISENKRLIKSYRIFPQIIHDFWGYSLWFLSI